MTKEYFLQDFSALFSEKIVFFPFSHLLASVCGLHRNNITYCAKIQCGASCLHLNNIKKKPSEHVFWSFSSYLCIWFKIQMAMAKGKYNLGFISDSQIYEHVKETVEQYKTVIGLDEFNHNIIDPVKLTFDSKVYGKSFEEIIEAECIRQIDKANNNHIGYFHQNLFRYVGQGWRVPDKGFDVVNDERKIYVEIKNKHNTMNSSSGQATYIKMQNQLLRDSDSTCMLVEVIAKQSQNITWSVSLSGVKYNHKSIRRISVDKFYEIVFGAPDAFMKLCRALPTILDDVIKETHKGKIDNSVYKELKGISSDTFKSLYLLAFNTYEGFDRF